MASPLPVVGALFLLISIYAANEDCVADTLSDVDSLIQQSNQENGEGNYTEAENHLRQALLQSVQHIGAMSSVSGKVSRLLADFYMSRGRYADAEHYLQRALVIDAGYSGAVSDSQGEFQNTRYFITQSIQNPGNLPGTIEIANTLSSLSNCYIRQERYADAERMLKKVVQIYNTNGNAGNLLNYAPNSALILAEHQKSLAQVLTKEGNVLEAESMFKSYVDTVRTARGPSPELADALANLAAFYKGQNRSSDADQAESESKELQSRFK